MKYVAKYKPNQVICGEGDTVVVTGWTPKESVKKRLDKLGLSYGAIGNLYSPTRGISFLVRNLLYNPQIKNILIIEATKEDTNSRACLCLKDFFLHGFKRGKTSTGRKTWLVDSSVEGYIDSEISYLDLDELRSSVFIKPIDSLDKIEESYKWFETRTKSDNTRVQKVYEDPESLMPTVLPGTRYGHRIEGKTIAETWVKILHRIKSTGTIRPTGYDGQWQELIDLTAVVTDEPKEFYFPEPNYLPIDRDFLTNYIPQILEDAPYKEGVKYTYGQRLRSWFKVDQIEQVIQKLIKEIDAASAVMSLWDTQDHIKGGSPCLNHIWLRVVDNELSLTATFRSNDMFGAWVANAMGLRALQVYIRNEIATRSDYDLSIGPLITISQSAHIYSDTWEHADQVIDKHYRFRPEYSDPVGNFLVEKRGKDIVVNQTNLCGEIIKSYSSENALKLIREITQDNPSIQPYHVGYLGIELEKAFSSGSEYVQK